MRYVIISIIGVLIFCTDSIAQVPNGSFENWESVNNYREPVSWNTSNQFTTNSTIFMQQAESLVTEDSMNAQHAGSSARLKTKEFNLQLQTVAVPGVATNGDININAQSFLSGNIDFEQAIDGGSPFTKRPGQLNGYYTYNPAGTDSFFVFVRLTYYDANNNNRKTIADGQLRVGGAQSTFAKFSLNLDYQSCQTPDTMLVAVLSSDGIGGRDNTILHVDSLSFGGNAPNFAPTAMNDAASTDEDKDVMVSVTQNDSDCDGNIDTIEVIKGPNNGTATVMNNGINYSPSSGFTGQDTIMYRICDNGSPIKCDTANAYITVDPMVGIDEISGKDYNINLYPVPTTGNELTLSVDKKLVGSKLKIFNLLGKEILEKPIKSTETIVNISKFGKGVYLYHISDEQGRMLIRDRFNVVR